MFCSKCGTKAIDDADFCQKCGARLVKDEPEISPQADDIPSDLNAISFGSNAASVGSDDNPAINNAVPTYNTTAPSNAVRTQSHQPVDPSVPSEVQEAYINLTESNNYCPQIKQIAISKDFRRFGPHLVIRGGFYNYEFGFDPNSKEPLLFSKWRLIIYIIFFPLIICDGLLVTFLFQGDAYPLLTILCILGCIAWYPLLYFFNKEFTNIAAHINNTLGLNLTISKANLIISGIFNSIELVLCFISFGMMS